MLRRKAFRLPRHPASVGVARTSVGVHLTAWGHGPDAGIRADTVLLVSELATNAVLHGPHSEHEFEVAVTVLAHGSCFIEVSDGSPYEAVLQSPGVHGALRTAAVTGGLATAGAPAFTDAPGERADRGHGLRIVEDLSDAWGVLQRGRYGKTVWALVTITP